MLVFDGGRVLFSLRTAVDLPLDYTKFNPSNLRMLLQTGQTCRNATPGSALTNTMNNCALIVGDWKLVTGGQNLLGFWQGPRYPNSSSIRVQLNAGCPYGCLFDVRRDRSEQYDRKAEVRTVHIGMRFP